MVLVKTSKTFDLLQCLPNDLIKIITLTLKRVKFYKIQTEGRQTKNKTFTERFL